MSSLLQLLCQMFVLSGSKATVTEVRVSGCEVPPCLLKRGEDIVVEIDFENCESLVISTRPLT